MLKKMFKIWFRFFKIPLIICLIGFLLIICLYSGSDVASQNFLFTALIRLSILLFGISIGAFIIAYYLSKDDIK